MMKIEETGEVFACNFSFPITEAKELTVHCLRALLADGKGTHRSIGVVDPNTDEVIVPPSVGFLCFHAFHAFCFRYFLQHGTPEDAEHVT